MTLPATSCTASHAKFLRHETTWISSPVTNYRQSVLINTPYSFHDNRFTRSAVMVVLPSHVSTVYQKIAWDLPIACFVSIDCVHHNQNIPSYIRVTATLHALYQCRLHSIPSILHLKHHTCRPDYLHSGFAPFPSSLAPPTPASTPPRYIPVPQRTPSSK
jgi:hypothetical protein